MLVSRFLPKLVLERTPQKSPPLGRRSWAFPFDRSQSGTKLRLSSIHARVTPAVPKAIVVDGIRSVGLVLAYSPATPAPSRYLPACAFNPVRPVPKTSSATPNLGVTSV